MNGYSAEGIKSVYNEWPVLSPMIVIVLIIVITTKVISVSLIGAVTNHTPNLNGFMLDIGLAVAVGLPDSFFLVIDFGTASNKESIDGIEHMLLEGNETVAFVLHVSNLNLHQRGMKEKGAPLPTRNRVPVPNSVMLLYARW